MQWRSRRLTAKLRLLPSCIILGAARSGTTALFESLSDHPQLAPAFRKEVHFFDLHHGRGTDWYRANFAPQVLARSRGLVAAEATPAYLAHPLVPARVHTVVPTARLVVLLRDPVARAHSQWRLRVNMGVEDRSFEAAIEAELSRIDVPDEDHLAAVGVEEYNLVAYARRGLYARQLRRWFATFDREQMLVSFSEDLWASGGVTYREIQTFAGLDPQDLPLPRVHHQRGSDLDTRAARRLEDFFAPHNADLAELLGRTRLPW